MRDDQLYVTAVYRSQNMFGSQPGNVIALRQVQNYAAKRLKVKVGTFHLAVLSAHIYEKELILAQQLVETASITS